MDIVNENGEVVDPETVEFAYTRQGRKEIGKEFPNPVPLEAPFGTTHHEPIWDMIKRLVMDGTRRQIEQETGDEFDTEEEADDFEVGDDYDPSTPYEEVHEPTDPWPMSTAAQQLERAINEKRNAARIDTLRAELEALQNGQPWPPVSAKDDPAGGAGGT